MSRAATPAASNPAGKSQTIWLPTAPTTPVRESKGPSSACQLTAGGERGEQGLGGGGRGPGWVIMTGKELGVGGGGRYFGDE